MQGSTRLALRGRRSTVIFLFAMFRFRRRRGYNLMEREMLAAQRTSGVRQVVRVAAVIVLVIAAFLGSMIVLSPLFDLYELREEKELMEQKLERARRIEQKYRNRYEWMQDPEYYEQIARDRANMAKEGETIIRPAEPKRTSPEESSHRPD